MRWLCIALMIAGCDGAARDSSTQSTTTTAAATTATAAATASEAAPASPHAGRWTGQYVAKKGEVEIPEGIPYKWWEKDEGDEAAGQGDIVLSIDGDGVVTGQVSGALGDLKVQGKLEEGTLSAGVSSDADDGHGMRGVLTGTLDGETIQATLRVSSHDAAIVRSADTQLSRGK